ncbi:GFA family protein [Undibacterium squillarum]|uniref:CENP-V/GFA domain-containing protein n=1 Tax=Undibacterium squillarum TaxID=1131567 RepID=A0ABQ2XSU9_9BURK|nr:GFA family protein [Undibacterium squillarum]GGX32534.1 hypothetical protein GCM10010946_07190 [Undibacterium squillarum]
MQQLSTGSCLCGLIRYEIQGMINDVSHCYCRMCQKAHGAACGSYANVPTHQFRWIQGQEYLKTYHSSPGVQRLSCQECASPLIWQSGQHFPGMVSCSLGTLDTPLPPLTLLTSRHLYAEQQPAWHRELLAENPRK